MVELVSPIVDEPALLVNFSDKKILCIADLHLGYEFLLAERGVAIPSQAEEMEEKILELVERTGVDALVIIGDVKHNIFGISSSELRGISRLLERVSKEVDVQIALGNHDANLDLLLPNSIVVHSAKGFLVKGKDIKVGFVHGHAWPSPELFQADYIVVGHNHPVIEMRDELGGRWYEPAWIELQWDKVKIMRSFAEYLGLRKSLDPREALNGLSIRVGNPKIILVPAFSPLLGGVALNRPGVNFLGPMLSSDVVERSATRVKLLDGTFLGTLENCSRLVRQEEGFG